MITFSERPIDFIPQGGVFDVDDTLLDNQQGRPAGEGLHDHSRLAAIHEVGLQYDIPELMTVTTEESHEAFLAAATHTIDAAVWGVLLARGLAAGEQDPDDVLLREILDVKNHLHHTIIATEAREVAGSTRFVEDFSQLVEGRVAAASGGVRPDIDLYFGMVGLQHVIQPDRIITQENVTNPKPHPEMFDKGFRTLGLPEDARQYVCGFEDDMRGIRSIKSAGLYACALTTRYDSETFLSAEVPPDVVADSWEEYRAYFGLSA